MENISFKGFLRSGDTQAVLDAVWIGELPRSGGRDIWIAAQSDDSVFQFSLTEGAMAQWQQTETNVMPAQSAIDGAEADASSSAAALWLWDGGTAVTVLTDPAGAASKTSWEPKGTQHHVVSILPITATQIVSFDAQGFSVFQKSSTTWTETSSFADTSKSAASHVTASAVATIGQSSFLLTGSEVDNGLSVFRLQGGTAELVDTIGAKDGLWATGISDLAVITIGATTFIVAASAGSNTLISLRLNAQGVLFVEDIAWDTQATRFAGATDLETFDYAGRHFVLLGGKDFGLSLFELLPNGQMLHHQSVAQSAAWSISGLTEIEALVVGSELQIFASSAGQNGIAQLSLDLSQTGLLLQAGDIGGGLSGGSKDDILIGGAGDDVLRGNAGDDMLIAGAGKNRLVGGAGNDVFVFLADDQKDVIADFQQGEDRIDLSDWGWVFDLSALAFRQRPYGADIQWGDQIIEVRSAQGTPITQSDWSADDFIF